MKYIKLFENFDINSINDICKQYRIKNFTINDDGSIDVNGDVDLYGKGFKKLPLKFNRVEGNFCIESCGLTTLEGSPKYVGGDFTASNNKLKTLVGAPEIVNGSFYGSLNKITNLIGAPIKVGSYFSVPMCNLTSLEGSPEYVGDLFNCDDKNLKTIIGLKSVIGGKFFSLGKLNIIYNILKENLEYIPHFYDYNIITDLDNEKPTLNLKRLNRFSELYDIEISEHDRNELKIYYNII